MVIYHEQNAVIFLIKRKSFNIIFFTSHYVGNTK